MNRRVTLVVLVIVVLLVLGAAVALSQFSLSALSEPGPAETYLVTSAKRYLVSRSAGGLTPARVENPALSLASGQMTFGGSCATCHGFDGRTPTAIGRAQYPPAPDLGSPRVQDWSDAELFWIIKNGIRFSGMPGFGRIHSDEDIWNLVRYVRSLSGSSRK